MELIPPGAWQQAPGVIAAIVIVVLFLRYLREMVADQRKEIKELVALQRKEWIDGNEKWTAALENNTRVVSENSVMLGRMDQSFKDQTDKSSKE